MTGKVIHVKDMPRFPDAVYVGRRVPRLGIREGSPFGNPFPVAMGRDACIALFRQHLLASPELLAQLPALRGKPLACWCRHDGQEKPACHGDVILELLDRYTDDELRRMAVAR